MAILDADKEGFLRSETSLDPDDRPIRPRTSTRRSFCTRDKVTDSMQRAIDETRPTAGAAAGVQPGARHHARDDPKSIRAGIEAEAAAHRRGERSRRPHRGRPNTSPRSTSTSWKPKCWRPRRRWSSNGPPQFATGSKRCGSRSGKRSIPCAKKRGASRVIADARERKPTAKARCRGHGGCDGGQIDFSQNCRLSDAI